MKYIIKRYVLALLRSDPEFRRDMIKAINPDYAWELEYGNRKHPPPKPSFVRIERTRFGSNIHSYDPLAGLPPSAGSWQDESENSA